MPWLMAWLLAACLACTACGGASTAKGGGGADGGSDSGGAPVPAPDALPPPADAQTPDVRDPNDDSPPGFCRDHVANSSELPGKPAAAFCDEYQRVCGFGRPGRYADRNDCLALYLAAAAGVQSCRAAYLCYAESGSPADHCPHAAGQTTVTRCRGN
jgi:hypothetical protein